jgi:beta-lactamase regulating signal transducer with metallopeptidase domain/Flp pilus assembly protein TadD
MMASLRAWLAAAGWDAETAGYVAARGLETAGDLALKGAVLLLAAWAIAGAARRASASARSLIWSLGLCGALALTLIYPFAPGLDWGPNWRSVWSPSPILPTPASPVPAASGDAPAASCPDGLVAATAPTSDPTELLLAAKSASLIELPLPEASAKLLVLPDPAQPPAAKSAFSWPLALMGVWAAGALAALAPLALGLARLSALSRRARPVADPAWRLALEDAAARMGVRWRLPILLETTEAVSPMTWGFWRPVVALPSRARRWPMARLRAAMFHEMAHVARFDWPIQVAAQVVCAMNWFNPLFWMARRRLLAERESACDDRALLAAQEAPSSYAKHLLEIARARWASGSPLAVAAAAEHPSELERRVRAVLDADRSRTAPSNRAAGFALAGSLGLALLLASAGPIAAQGWAGGGDRDALIEKADEAFNDREWKKAAHAYEKAISEDGRLWFNLGFSRHAAGDLDGAAEAFHNALNMGYMPGHCAYNIACGRALAGEPEKAFKWLDKAIGLGFDDPKQLSGDDDWKSLRDDRRFREASERVGKIASAREKAAAAYDKQDWEGANEAYAKLAKLGALTWAESYNVGYVHYRRDDFGKAAKAWEKAFEGNYKPETSAYNVACAFALQGKKDKALDWLEKAVERGWSDLGQLESDSDFESLRGSSEFQALVDKVAERAEDAKVAEEAKSWQGGLKSLFSGLKPSVSVEVMGVDAASLEDNWEEIRQELEAKKAADGELEGDDHSRYGLALHMLGERQEAIKVFKHCYENDIQKATAAYNVACGYALEGETSYALEWLGKAAKAGFNNAALMESDSDLESLRGDKRFKELLDVVRENAQSKGVELGLAIDVDLDGADLEKLLADLEKGGKAAREAAVELVAELKIETDEAGRKLVAGVELGEEKLAEIIQQALEQEFARNAIDKANAKTGEIRVKAEVLSDKLAASVAKALASEEDAYSQYAKERAKASALYADKKWREAIDAFYPLEARDALTNDERFQYAFALHSLGKYEDAIQIFRRLLDRNYMAPLCAYNVACGHARQGDKELAFHFLERAIEMGIDQPEMVKEDADLESLRGDKRFEKLLERVAQNAEESKDSLGTKLGAAAKKSAKEAAAKGKAAARAAEKAAKIAAKEAALAAEKAAKIAKEQAASARRATSGAAAFAQGMASYQSGDYKASRESFQKALELGFEPGASAYNIACGYARAGETEQALHWLKKAFDKHGFADVDLADRDSDLDNLRGDPRFSEWLESVRSKKKTAK